jgi:hypothetical protein
MFVISLIILYKDGIVPIEIMHWRKINNKPPTHTHTNLASLQANSA